MLLYWLLCCRWVFFYAGLDLVTLVVGAWVYCLVVRADLRVCIIGLMLWSFVVGLLCGCLLGVALFGVAFISVVILLVG